MERAEVECVMCTRKLPREAAGLYEPLKRFENHCICKECIRLYVEGPRGEMVPPAPR